MSRHAAKCKEKWQNEQKRLVHVPFGKKGAIYVPVAKYGLAFGDFKSEPIDEADQSIPAPMPIDENTMDSIESNWNNEKFISEDSNGKFDKTVVSTLRHEIKNSVLYSFEIH